MISEPVSKICRSHVKTCLLKITLKKLKKLQSPSYCVLIQLLLCLKSGCQVAIAKDGQVLISKPRRDEEVHPRTRYSEAKTTKSQKQEIEKPRLWSWLDSSRFCLGFTENQEMLPRNKSGEVLVLSCSWFGHPYLHVLYVLHRYIWGQSVES